MYVTSANMQQIRQCSLMNCKLHASRDTTSHIIHLYEFFFKNSIHLYMPILYLCVYVFGCLGITSSQCILHHFNVMFQLVGWRTLVVAAANLEWSELKQYFWCSLVGKSLLEICRVMNFCWNMWVDTRKQLQRLLIKRENEWA